MQLKIFKRITVIMLILIAVTIAISLGLWLNRSLWQDYSVAVYLGLLFLILLSFFGLSYYETNADRNIIKKMVANGQIALAKITNGSFERFGRDTRLRKYVFWNLDVTIYDEDNNQVKTSMIEKFNVKQTQIPKGYVYVTYDRTRPEMLFIVPNVLISVFPELQPKVEKYEKEIKPVYLNTYYNNGMLIETFKETMKKEDNR